MQNVAILSTPNLAAPNSELNAKSGESNDAFKQVLTQKISHDKTTEQASKKAEKTADSKPAKAADAEAQPVEQADTQSTELATELPIDALKLKELKARLEKESLNAAKKNEKAADETQPDQNAALVASLQLPPSGVKPVDAASKPDDAEQVAQAAEGMTRQVDLRDKLMTKSDKPETKPESPTDKLEKGAGREESDDHVQAAPLNPKAEKFSEQLSSAIAGKSLPQKEQSVSLDLGKGANEAATKLAEIATAVQAAKVAPTLSTPPGIETSTHQLIAPTFGASGWNEAVNQKVVWMVGAQQQSATLTLNPPDMGPVQVVVSVNNDKADTTFVSDNPEVRKALQDGLADLRNQLDQAGVTLGQTNISNQQQFQQFRQSQGEAFQQASHSNAANHASPQALEHANARSAVVRTSQGLVDTFA